MQSYIRLLRPSQWLKNTFVFAPLIFSKHLFDETYVTAALIAFVAFSLVSSAVYIINDIVDREADKLHPIKKERPIASGKISSVSGSGIAVIIFSSGLYLSQILPLFFTGILLSYFILQLLYSFTLKHVVILDIFV
ncbi:MAG: UbiA family prenyltransferase, partial [Bacteroidota bacterium]